MLVKSLSVLTVTYDNRWHLLKKILAVLENTEAVSNVIVVNNGVPYHLEEEILKNKFSKVKCINLDKNYGSAHAYKKGFEMLLKNASTEFIYLLDDDNLITRTSIPVLFDWWTKLKADFEPGKTALLSLRTDRPYLDAVARGEPVKFYFPQPNAFLGFNVLTFPIVIGYRLFKMLKQNLKNYSESVIIPMAPYGGLFFHKDLLNEIDLPDSRFFVYGDDFDFTYRITAKGGNIFLVPSSLIEDIDRTWLNKTKQGFLKSRYLQQNDFRSYYSVRNTTYFIKNHLVNNMKLFRVNQTVYLIYLRILALFSGRKNEFAFFHRAVNDGMKGVFKNEFHL